MQHNTSIQTLLTEIASTLDDRGQVRDQDDGERSMQPAVKAFWEIFGDSILKRGYMLESEGWYFMVLLKLTRSTGGSFRRDDHFDAAAYSILALESVEEENNSNE